MEALRLAGPLTLLPRREGQGVGEHFVTSPSRFVRKGCVETLRVDIIRVLLRRTDKGTPDRKAGSQSLRSKGSLEPTTAGPPVSRDARCSRSGSSVASVSPGSRRFAPPSF